LAEDSPQGLEELVLRLSRAAARFQVLSIVTPMRVGSTSALEKKLKANSLTSLLVCQPMFFTNGCAVEDFNWPDRIILGTPASEAVSALKQIFHPLVMRGVPVLVTNYETAELAREATTAFVATKISFINEIASLCEHVHADAVSLSLALGLDKKIAPRCLQPGAGMGGIFAESDMDSLTGLARENSVDLKILNAAREVNQNLAERLLQKVSGALETVQNKDVGILGLSFKPNTNSVAGSASVQLAQSLLAKGARVRAYDPVAIPEAKLQLNGTVKYCDSAYGVAEGADALVLATGWPEFRTLDFTKIRHLVKRPIIIDTKNLLDSSRLRAMGFQYMGVGRR
jgi:UDPglucose 6-dehydrogenase